ncbi:MAG: alpha/beta hydrolase [Bordetella sp.]|nr:alpha/beta hydrolase [Bordetella sp.]
MDTRLTPSGVRMRLRAARPGSLNWLLLPGGPGIGSESLHALADAMDVPGSIWLVDLPGDGSNLSSLPDPYAQWPQVLIEAADAVPDAVYLGHSTGGMYLLATPALHGRVRGIGLLDTAPDCSWHAEYVAMTQRDRLPAFEAALEHYERSPTLEHLTALVVASAEWNFEPGSVAAGRELLARMPYNRAAVEWSDAHFDHQYAAAWWPTDIPVLRLWGANDRIVSQAGWQAPRYTGAQVLAREIPEAGHFPWIEQPQAVAEAMRAFAARILAG